MKHKTKIKQHKKNYKLLNLYNFLQDIKPYEFILAIYLSKILNSYTLAMSLFTITHISNIIFEIPTGILSDKHTKKLSLTIGAILLTLTLIIYSTTTNYQTLIIASILQSLSSSFISGTNKAFIYQSITQSNQLNKKEKLWSKSMSMFHFGLLSSNLIIAILLLKTQNIKIFQTILKISILPQLITIIIPIFLHEKPNPKNKKVKKIKILKKGINCILKNSKLRNFTIANTIKYGFRENIYIFESAYTKNFYSLSTLSFIRSVTHLLRIISYNFSSKIINKLGTEKTIYITLFNGFIIDFTAVLTNNFLTPIIFMFNWFLTAPGSVASQLFMQKNFNENQRSTIGSIITMIKNLFLGTICLLVGIISDKYSPYTAILICAIFSKLFSIPFYYLALKKKNI